MDLSSLIATIQNILLCEIEHWNDMNHFGGLILYRIDIFTDYVDVQLESRFEHGDVNATMQVRASEIQIIVQVSETIDSLLYEVEQFHLEYL